MNIDVPEKTPLGIHGGETWRARVEEVEDEDDPLKRYKLRFPIAHEAGKTKGSAKTAFEILRDDQVLHGGNIHGPFADEEEWELAKWLMKNVGHTQAEAFLKLPIVRS